MDYAPSGRMLERRSNGSALVQFPSLPLTARGATTHSEWSPYEDNGGTAAAISGKGFVILAADTRLNGDFNFHTRDDRTKLCRLAPQTLLASSGMQADRLQLQEILKWRIKWYSFNNGGRLPSTQALAQLLSTTLYQRRGFPLYTFNILAGLDEQGNGVCYSYDAVGCTEPLNYGTTGTASSFIEPLLDCLILRRHCVGYVPHEMTQGEALTMLKHAFTGAAERDIFTGDSVRFMILTPQGLQEEVMALRRD